MKNKKRIGERLKRVKTYQAQQKILSDWALNWKTDQVNTVQGLRQAAERDDHSAIMYLIDQLQGMTENRFTALTGILSKLSDPDRRLIDNSQYEAASREPVPAVSKAEPAPVPRPKYDTYTQQNIIDDIVKSYNSNMTISEIAEWSNISANKVIKILVTAGVYTSETYDKIKYLREIGKTEEEISAKLGLSLKTMNQYTPYQKGLYNLENVSVNAKRLRALRQREAEKQTRN